MEVETVFLQYDIKKADTMPIPIPRAVDVCFCEISWYILSTRLRSTSTVSSFTGGKGSAGMWLARFAASSSSLSPYQTGAYASPAAAESSADTKQTMGNMARERHVEK